MVVPSWVKTPPQTAHKRMHKEESCFLSLKFFKCEWILYASVQDRVLCLSLSFRPVSVSNSTLVQNFHMYRPGTGLSSPPKICINKNAFQ